MALLESKSPDIRYLDSYMGYWREQLQLLKFKLLSVGIGVNDSVGVKVLFPLRAKYRLGVERMSNPVPGPIEGKIELEE